ARGQPLSEAEAAAAHQELARAADLVQQEQLALLRCLAQHHGLRKLYAEGLTPQSLLGFLEQVQLHRALEANELPTLLRQRTEVGDLGAARLEAEVLSLLDRYCRERAELGAAGRLLLANELEVLPLEEEGLLEAARPVTPDGRVRIDPAQV